MKLFIVISSLVITSYQTPEGWRREIGSYQTGSSPSSSPPTSSFSPTGTSTSKSTTTSGTNQKPEVSFTLGNLGDITGVESRTKVYEEAEYSDRPIYVFRGIPYAHPVINENRFKQSQIYNDTALTQDGTSFDATRDGPLCQQEQKYRFY